MNRSHIIEALRAADWSNTPNGNLALIQAAIEHLEAQHSSAMGRVPDAVVEPKSRYIHRNGVEYEVVMIANGESTNPKYPPTIVYRGVANGKVWARPACDWDRSMKLVERPDAVEVEGTEQVSSTWLAQPSPAPELPERGTQHRFSTTEQTCRHDFYGVWWNDDGVTKTGRECRECGFFIADIAEAPELERPEVVGYLATAEHPKHGQPHKAFNYFKDQHDAQVAHWRERGCEVSDDELMTVAQHGRIVGALRAKADQLREALEWRKENQAGQRELLRSVTAERDAALARVAKLEHSQSFQRDIDYSVLSEYADKHRLHFNNLCAVVRSALIALPAQAGQVPDILTEDDMKWLRRFAECCEDSDAGGHDLPKAAVKQLVQIGALRHSGPGRQETTAFGDWLLDTTPVQGGFTNE
ncbi:hypothetical protein [Pseudomonas aeruginosa]|uniref:hypothetical protein n=1 Tax=Pseudomonas aeruginosa TaxID=287 RepID=UPI001661F798|nr:hypothetical protein [Pseudomonas aeruginosa]